MSYVRVSILGAGPSGEVWSVNPVFDPSGEIEPNVNQTNLDAAALAIANRSIPASLLSLMSGSLTRTGARVEVRANSDDALLGISVAGSTSALPGTGTLKLPLQGAVVFSIRTDTPGGRGRGRLYWPGVGASLNTTGRMSGPTPSAAAADMKAYLLGIRQDLATAFPLIGFDLAVRSKADALQPHAVRIQVGDIVDTQRRRRDALVEQYTQVSFP